MKLKIPNQYEISVETGCNNIVLTQEANGNVDEIWIAPENAERFCVMVMKCAREMQNGGVKSE